MIVAGIDPGKTGALFVTAGIFRAETIHSVPLLKIKGKEKPDFDRLVRDWTGALLGVDHVFIEQVGAMPGQGVSSMFNFGYIAGFMGCIARDAGCPVTYLTPQKWKKIVGLSGSDGEESRRRASQLFPTCLDFWPLKKHDGRAEAALIAYAGTQILNGEINVR